jgi:hypothetical protein
MTRRAAPDRADQPLAASARAAVGEQREIAGAGDTAVRVGEDEEDDGRGTGAAQRLEPETGIRQRLAPILRRAILRLPVLDPMPITTRRAAAQ